MVRPWSGLAKAQKDTKERKIRRDERRKGKVEDHKTHYTLDTQSIASKASNKIKDLGNNIYITQEIHGVFKKNKYIL